MYLQISLPCAGCCVARGYAIDPEPTGTIAAGCPGAPTPAVCPGRPPGICPDSAVVCRGTPLGWPGSPPGKPGCWPGSPPGICPGRPPGICPGRPPG